MPSKVILPKNMSIVIIETSILTKEQLIITRINVDRGLGPALVAHGPGWVDQAPVGWARDSLIRPPGGPGVRFAKHLEWQQ